MKVYVVFREDYGVEWGEFYDAMECIFLKEEDAKKYIDKKNKESEEPSYHYCEAEVK